MDVLIEHEKLSNFALKAQIKVTSTFIAILHFTYELVPIWITSQYNTVFEGRDIFKCNNCSNKDWYCIKKF